MLKTIRLKSFKLHEDTKIDAAPITVFIGPNNSGKSSIFQALLLLRQAASRGNNSFLASSAQRQDTTADNPFLFDASAIVDLGEFGNIARHTSQDIQIGLEGEVRPADASFDLVRGAGTIQLGFDTFTRNNQLARHEGWLKCGYGEGRWNYPKPTPAANFSVGGIQVSLMPLGHFQMIQSTYSVAGHSLTLKCRR